MSEFRLLNAQGTPLETFEAADDTEARELARDLARHHTSDNKQGVGQRVDFSVAKLDDQGDWWIFWSWVPRST